MKRNVIVSKLVKEGFSEKTLVKFTDKQLSELAERMLSEEATNQPQVTANVNDPNFNQVMSKLKQSGVQNINVTEEDEIGESKKKKVKKPTIYDKALKDLGGEEGVIKFLEKGMKGDKKKEVKEIKNWVKTLAEENFHSFTSKNEIMELIQYKLNESESTNKPKVPEFMSYSAIKSSGPATAPTKPKTSPGTKPGTSPGKPKPRTPYEPGIGPKHKPKAGYGIKEEDVIDDEEMNSKSKVA
jgi:hypothetical protein